MSTINFTPDAAKTTSRGDLAKLIAGVLGQSVTYAAAPSFAYQIGQTTLDRDWQLNVAGLSDQQVEAIIEACRAAGLQLASEPSSDEMGLTVSVPISGWDEGTQARLQALLASKTPLICKALGIDSLPMEVDTGEGVVRFAWFTKLPDPDTVEAVTRLITAMVEYAKNTTRINPAVREVVNEKYAMRCFLLRLGMIGDETKHARRVLMRNLGGNSAWRTPPTPRGLTKQPGAGKPLADISGGDL